MAGVLVSYLHIDVFAYIKPIITHPAINPPINPLNLPVSRPDS